MSALYPTDGLELMRIRRAGQRPADVVFVRFSAKPISLPNPILTVEPGTDPVELDWSMLHDLDVLVIVRRHTDLELWTNTILAILHADPLSLAAYFLDERHGLWYVWNGEVDCADWQSEDDKDFAEYLSHA